MFGYVSRVTGIRVGPGLFVVWTKRMSDREVNGGIDVIDQDFQSKLIEINVCPMCHNKSLLPVNREPRHVEYML
jgi:hypothetical protein